MSAPSLFNCVVEQFEARDPWLAGRQTLFGASDSAGLFGEGYADQSPITICDSKINKRESDNDDKRLAIGRFMEPALRSIFTYETGLPCVGIPEFTIFRSKDRPWLGATLDDATVHDEYGPCPVELKNVSNFNRDDWNGDAAPLKFQIQVQHQLAVTGASHGFLLGLIGGSDPMVKTIERNDRFISQVLLPKLEVFWGYVQRNELPPVDESMATRRLLAKIFSKETGETVNLPADATQWAADLQQAKKDIADAEARETFAHNKITAAIGNATYGVTPDGVTFSWKTQNKKQFTVPASSTRVLRRCK